MRQVCRCVRHEGNLTFFNGRFGFVAPCDNSAILFVDQSSFGATMDATYEVRRVTYKVCRTKPALAVDVQGDLSRSEQTVILSQTNLSSLCYLAQKWNTLQLTQQSNGQVCSSRKPFTNKVTLIVTFLLLRYFAREAIIVQVWVNSE